MPVSLHSQISTLRFATRMMNVANDPVQNVHHDSAVSAHTYDIQLNCAT